jgi:hypothetical protein
VQTWRNQTDNPQQLIKMALSLFHEEFTYTLRPPQLGLHSVDEFLFKTKSGFCEHFAGSFTFIMRAAGIPARIVAGYQGGEANSLSDYFLIRQADAHAWTEVWLPEQGWVRVDPTNAVAPERIEKGLDAAIPIGERPGLNWRLSSSVTQTLNLFWDSINNRWNLWILAYGPENQLLFLSQLFGFKTISAYNMTTILVIVVATLLIAIFLFSLSNKTKNQIDAIQRAYLNLCSHLEKVGFRRLPHEGPASFAERIHAQNPAAGNILEPLLMLYARLRYGRHSGMRQVRLFKRRIRQTRRTLRKTLNNIPS